MRVVPLTPGIPVSLSISAVGGGFQAINLGIHGRLVVDSGLTR